MENIQKEDKTQLKIINTATTELPLTKQKKFKKIKKAKRQKIHWIKRTSLTNKSRKN